MFLNDHLTYLKAVSYVPNVINTIWLKHKAITKYVGYGYDLDQLQILTLVQLYNNDYSLIIDIYFY